MAIDVFHEHVMMGQHSKIGAANAN